MEGVNSPTQAATTHFTNCIANRATQRRNWVRESVLFSATAEDKLQGRTVNAQASSADEGRGTLRKAPGRRVQPYEPEMSEWRNPHGGMPMYGVMNT